MASSNNSDQEESNVALMLEKLKRKRAIIRGLLTRAINKIPEQLSLDIIDKAALNEIFHQICEKSEQIFDLDIKIEDYIDDLDELEAEVINSQDIRDKVISAKEKINACLNSEVKLVNENNESLRNVPATLINEPLRNVSLTTNVQNEASVRLPKLTIEPFDGKYENWQEFWSQFEGSIHENKNLSKVDKFSYLKSFLKGQALISIQGLTLTDNNYDTAINLLKERYGQKDIIVRSHVNKLLNMQPVKSCGQLKELRQLCDTCYVQVRSLETAGVELNSYGTLLFPILLKLMPDSIVLDYNRNNKTDDWDCLKLLKFLREEIENREKTNLFRYSNEEKISGSFNQKYSSKTAKEHDKSNSYYRSVKPKTYPSVSSFSVGTRESGEGGNELICVFCETQNHSSDKCIKSIEEKRNALRQKRKCFLCFKKNHMVLNCYSKIRCEKCKKKHNTLLHENNAECNKIETKSDTAVTSVSQGKEINNDVYLQTATADLVGKNINKKVRCLIDNGSCRTFILERVSRDLKLRIIGQEELKIYTFGSSEPIIEKRKKVLVKIRCPFLQRYLLIEALETPNISSASISVPAKDIRSYCLRNRMRLADQSAHDNILEISMLIGSDNYWKIISGKIRRLSDTLVACESVFGWTVNGSEAMLNNVSTQQTANVMNVAIENTLKDNRDDETSVIFRKLWDLEAIGIYNNFEKNEIDKEILDEFNKSIVFNNDCYEVTLPFNERVNELNDNYEIALKRMVSLTRKFRNNPDFYHRYRKVIEDYLERGIAEEVSVLDSPEKIVFYLPHQGVLREDKVTTKLRVVFDASAHATNVPSLNDCLSAGPNLNPDLLGILLKFRQHKIGFSSDVEQAFLRLWLRPENRDAVRFLWLDGELEADVHFKILRMTRVIFGATCSPFLLAATLKHHAEKFKEEFPKIYELINECMYVDDLISGADSESEAMEIQRDMKNVMKKGSFNIRKWKTNSPSLQIEWEKEEASDLKSCEKVLGYVWDNKEDKIKIQMPEFSLDTNQEITKRMMLKVIGKVYDPIGIINPFTITSKLLLQDSWRAGTNWDDPLPEDIQRRFRDWCDDLRYIEHINIDRHYFSDFHFKEISNIQLHCFCDSSIKAYGAVIYLRYVKDNEIKTSLVISKSRIAPLKKITLPRLELMGALIGARLSDYVLKTLNLKITERFFWTDSTIVIHWIKGDPNKWKPFVSNRVVEIQEKTDPSSWNFCPGEENPADALTRGETSTKLQENFKWFHGPKWLTENSGKWPALYPDLESKGTEDEKKGGKECKILQTCCIESKIEDLLEISRINNFLKLIRITAWVKRFLFNLKEKSERKAGPLSEEELQDSEIYWIKRSQEKMFFEEISALSSGKDLPISSKIGQFKPFLDEKGLIRIGGRLQHSNLSYEQKHPILLDGHDNFTELIIRRCHEQTGHAGLSETLTDLRERFFVLKGRQRVKTIIGKCNLCKIFRTKPATQDMASLPPDRVREAFPFEVTGIDYLGPLYTKETNDSESKKCYILLFTCAVTRAVHLELSPDMTTATFLNAFKKFISRRGLCKIVYSDNAKTFLKVKKELNLLNETLKKSECQDYFSEKGIKWKNIIEKAAWWGGFWERLVRSVKSPLKKILFRSCLSYLELETVVIQVEAILNSRPLTYVEEQTDSFPLTPAHFLIGRRVLSIPGQFMLSSSTKDVLTRRYKYQQKLVDSFWCKWRDNYLCELRSAHQSPLNKNNLEIKKDSIVQIHDQKVPKLMWKCGRVSDLHIGRDGKVRSCTVKLPNGVLLKRPVQLLYPLELDE